jgi:hypothetical protein
MVLTFNELWTRLNSNSNNESTWQSFSIRSFQDDFPDSRMGISNFSNCEGEWRSSNPKFLDFQKLRW